MIDDCGISRKAIAGALDVLDGSVLGTNTCLRGNGSVCNIGRYKIIVMEYIYGYIYMLVYNKLLFKKR